MQPTRAVLPATRYREDRDGWWARQAAGCPDAEPTPRRWRAASASRQRVQRWKRQDRRSPLVQGFRQSAHRARFRKRRSDQEHFQSPISLLRPRKARILLDVTKASALAGRYFAAIGIHLASKDSQKRRLARSVRPNQADAITLRDSERDILKKRLRSKGFRDFLRVDDRRQLSCGSGCVS